MFSRHISRIGCSTGFLLLGAGLIRAQSASVPVTPSLASVLPSTSSTTQTTPARRAEVVYSKGQLLITANNSSLNQILIEVARRTGIKLVGSVADERIFGMYGPATPDKMLEILLDGTETNMLLTGSAEDTTRELMLTPRQTASTPPRLSSSEPVGPAVAAEQQEPQTQPPQPSMITSKVPEMPGPNDSTSPSGVLTPQQRYLRIQDLQQQQQQTAKP